MTAGSKTKRRFQIEKLEERIAPAHVSLPGAPTHQATISAAADQNPHFSGDLKPLPFVDPIQDFLRPNGRPFIDPVSDL